MAQNTAQIIIKADGSQARRELSDVASSGSSSFKTIAAAAASAAAAYFSFSAANSLIRESIHLAGIQETQEIRLAAVTRATGEASGFTAAELYKMAGGLQEVTTFGDEATIGAMAVLATFKQIKGDIFERATRAAQDMAVTMGNGAANAAQLEAAMLQVGKALQEPITGMSALSRVGVTFSEAQKEQVKGLIESGDLMAAQRVILAELEGQFKGAAAAARGTWAGAVTAAGNALGDLKEQLGFVITRNQVFIDLVKAAEERFVAWGSVLEKHRDQLKGWASGAVDAISAVANAAGHAAKIVGGYFVYLALAAAMRKVVVAAGVLRVGLAGLFTETGVLTVGAFNQALFGTRLALKDVSTAAGVTKIAVSGLFAAFIGWEIGKWLFEEFETARIAGATFFGGLARAFIELEFGAKAAWAGVKAAFFAVADEVGKKFADLLFLIGSAMERLGAVDTAAAIGRFAVKLSSPENRQTVRQAMDALLKEREIAIQQHNQVVDEMLADAMGVKSVAPPKPKESGGDDGGGGDGGGGGDYDAKKKAQEDAQAWLDSEAAFAAFQQQKADIERARMEEAAQLQEELTARINQSVLSEVDYKRWALEQEIAQMQERAAGEQAVLDQIAKYREIKEQEISNFSAKQALDRRMNQLSTFTAQLRDAAKYNGAALAVYKTSATAETIIGTYTAAQQAYAAMAGIPYIGPALGIAAAAAAIASGMARVASIQSTQAYADGGLVTSPTIGLVGEAGDEVIIPLAPDKASRRDELAGRFLPARSSGMGNTTNVSVAITFSGPVTLDASMEEIKSRIGQSVADAVRGAMN